MGIRWPLFPQHRSFYHFRSRRYSGYNPVKMKILIPYSAFWCKQSRRCRLSRHHRNKIITGVLIDRHSADSNFHLVNGSLSRTFAVFFAKSIAQFCVFFMYTSCIHRGIGKINNLFHSPAQNEKLVTMGTWSYCKFNRCQKYVYTNYFNVKRNTSNYPFICVYVRIYSRTYLSLGFRCRRFLCWIIGLIWSVFFFFFFL